MHLEKGAKAVHYESGPDMTPLVDVVMVLLIFLMMAGKFGGMTRYLVSDVGVVSTGNPGPVDPTKEPKTEVTLNVTQPVPDQFRAFYAQTVNADNQDALATQLKTVLTGYTGQGKKVDDVQLFIKPGRDVRYAHVVRVYSAAMQAGFTKIGFHTAE